MCIPKCARYGEAILQKPYVHKLQSQYLHPYVSEIWWNIFANMISTPYVFQCLAYGFYPFLRSNYKYALVFSAFGTSHLDKTWQIHWKNIWFLLIFGFMRSEIISTHYFFQYFGPVCWYNIKKTLWLPSFFSSWVQQPSARISFSRLLCIPK